jgi:hypothetical protein
MGDDLKPDGTISSSGIAKIEALAGQSDVKVVFLRAKLSDAGLAQLAKFPFIKQVVGAGGRVTDPGIQKLKAAIPNVEVFK